MQVHQSQLRSSEMKLKRCIGLRIERVLGCADRTNRTAVILKPESQSTGLFWQINNQRSWFERLWRLFSHISNIVQSHRSSQGIFINTINVWSIIIFNVCVQTQVYNFSGELQLAKIYVLLHAALTWSRSRPCYKSSLPGVRS